MSDEIDVNSPEFVRAAKEFARDYAETIDSGQPDRPTPEQAAALAELDARLRALRDRHTDSDPAA
jgi:hypothetical protein